LFDLNSKNWYTNTFWHFLTGAADSPTSCSWYQPGGVLTAGQYLVDPDLSGDTVQYRTQCNSYGKTHSMSYSIHVE